MSSKKIQVWLPLAFSGIMVIGMVIGFQLKEKTMSASFFSLSNKSTIQELSDLIKSRYVDQVALDSINGIVATDLLQKLDPHSVYIPREELLAVNEEMAGNFQGIGIEFRLINDTVNVMSVLSGGPADKAGMLVGDKLVSVNDSIQIAGVKIDGLGVRKLFRGETGTSVKIKFKRGNVLQSLVVTRGVIPVSSIDAAYMITDTIGYIRINKFAERTYEEFMQALEKLLAAKMKSLIVDLRGNGGGLMKEAVDIADEFLAENRGHFMIENIIEDGLNDFYFTHLYKYKESWTSPIHFTGSIAFAFKDVLKDLCNSYELELGKVLKTPMSGLIAYHQ